MERFNITNIFVILLIHFIPQYHQSSQNDNLRSSNSTRVDETHLYLQIQIEMENQYDQLLKINYGAIQDKNQLENTIVEHKSIISNLIKQIHELTNIKDKEELERNIIINKMQENMLENTRQIINFKNMVNQITEEHQKLSKQFEDEKEKIRKSYQSQHITEMNDLNKRMEELESEYKSYHEIEEREQNYIKQIKNLKEGLISKQYEHHDNMNKEEKKQVKENIELTNENQNRIVEVKKNIYHVAKNIVIEEKYNNQEKNNQLKNKLLQLQNELSVIKKSRNDIMEKRKEFKINISLNEEELEEYKAVGSLQKAKIKANKDKIDQVKAIISQEVSKRQQKFQDLSKEKSNQIKNLKVKLLHLQKSKEEMKINLEKMKILGETILMQREQVEQFFIMALESCKKEIESENEKAFNIGKEKERSNYGDKVDIEELSPKDKQRILTNLYTKLALGP